MLARPYAKGVILPAPRCRIPVAVVRDESLTFTAGVVERHESDTQLRTFRGGHENLLQLIQVLHRLAVDRRDQAASRHSAGTEYVARIRHVDTFDRAVVVARLLVGKIVKNAVTVFEILIRRDRMKVVDQNRMLQRHTATLDTDPHSCRYAVIKDCGKFRESDNQFAVHRNENIAGSQ